MSNGFRQRSPWDVKKCQWLFDKEAPKRLSLLERATGEQKTEQAKQRVMAQVVRKEYPQYERTARGSPDS